MNRYLRMLKKEAKFNPLQLQLHAARFAELKEKLGEEFVNAMLEEEMNHQDSDNSQNGDQQATRMHNDEESDEERKIDNHEDEDNNKVRNDLLLHDE